MNWNILKKVSLREHNQKTDEGMKGVAVHWPKKCIKAHLFHIIFLPTPKGKRLEA